MKKVLTAILVSSVAVPAHALSIVSLHGGTAPLAPMISIHDVNALIMWSAVAVLGAVILFRVLKRKARST